MCRVEHVLGCSGDGLCVSVLPGHLPDTMFTTSFILAAACLARGLVHELAMGLCISLSLSVTRHVPCLSVSLSLCFYVSLTVFVARLCLCPCLCLPAHVPVPAPAPAPVPSIPPPVPILLVSLTLSSLVANCSQPDAGSPFLQLIK